MVNMVFILSDVGHHPYFFIFPRSFFFLLSTLRQRTQVLREVKRQGVWAGTQTPIRRRAAFDFSQVLGTMALLFFTFFFFCFIFFLVIFMNYSQYHEDYWSALLKFVDSRFSHQKKRADKPRPKPAPSALYDDFFVERDESLWTHEVDTDVFAPYRNDDFDDMVENMIDRL